MNTLAVTPRISQLLTYNIHAYSRKFFIRNDLKHNKTINVHVKL